MQSLHRYEESWDFHERDLHSSIGEWISVWIDSFDKYIITEGSSLIMQKKFLTLIDESESVILSGITDFVYFFFQSRNIVISLATTEAYARFILKNIRGNLEKALQNNPDRDLLQKEDSNDAALF